MSTKKIKILQDAVDGLESGRYHYSWTDMGSCNCGIVSQVALEMTSYQVDAKICRASHGKDIGLWTGRIKEAIRCEKTGIFVADIFRKLQSKGFTLKELVKLEHLADRRVLAKMGRKSLTTKYDDQNEFISYMKAWIEVLEEDDQKADLKVCQSINNDLKEPNNTNSKEQLLNN